MNVVRCNPAFHLFNRVLPWLDHLFYTNHFYVESRGEIDMNFFDCGEQTNTGRRRNVCLMRRKCKNDCVYQDNDEVV